MQFAIVGLLRQGGVVIRAYLPVEVVPEDVSRQLMAAERPFLAYAEWLRQTYPANEVDGDYAQEHLDLLTSWLRELKGAGYSFEATLVEEGTF
jgi:hypothetical protein